MSQNNFYDMRIFANTEKKTITTNALKYREGRPSFRRYDACYYEIQALNPRALLEEIEEKGEGLRIFVKFNRLKELQVYLYEGPTKFTAKTPVIPGNAPV